MSNRVIRIVIEKERALYEELYSAMMNHSEYEGCYIMQYSEFPENGQMTAEFMLRERGE